MFVSSKPIVSQFSGSGGQGRVVFGLVQWHTRSREPGFPIDFGQGVGTHFVKPIAQEEFFEII